MSPSNRLLVNNPKQKTAPDAPSASSFSSALRTDFTWSTTDEPHATRRKIILEAHPEMRKLFGPEIKTLPITLAVVAFQFAMAYLISTLDLAWPWLIVVTYCVSATANHCLMMISHELSHNLCFHTPEYNQLLAIFSNLPTAVPSAVTFKRYHMEHHQFQGVNEMDLDLPTPIEGSTVGGNTILKLIWVCLQCLFYSLRPVFVKPKPPGKWEFFNLTLQLSVDACVVYFLGLKSLFYMLFGTLWAVGLHPSGGHFIAEHYEFVSGAETYSYYGPMNYFNMNVGYHNEHHDFPKIPWSRLPMVRKIAPEFYETLPRHDSYLHVFWKYITDPSLGPFSRIKRKLPHHPANKKCIS